MIALKGELNLGERKRPYFGWKEEMRTTNKSQQKNWRIAVKWNFIFCEVYLENVRPPRLPENPTLAFNVRRSKCSHNKSAPSHLSGELEAVRSTTPSQLFLHIRSHFRFSSRQPGSTVVKFLVNYIGVTDDAAFTRRYGPRETS